MKIFVTHKIPGDALTKLEGRGREVLIGESIDKIADSDAILSLLTDRVDADLMDAAGPNLRVVSNYAVGFDNIDVKAASDRGVIIVNTPCDEVNESVAEHTWALLLGLSRRIVESDEFVRQEGYFKGKGGYQGWKPDQFLGTNLIGKTLGIVGMGRIGTMVARRAQGYKMNIFYCKKTRDKDAEREMELSFCDLDTILSGSDFVTLHVPLTEETRGMINKTSLKKMKKGSFLINTARGPVIVEKDLVEALESGHLAGAALDVFENEPKIHPKLIAMPNVILTPHIASGTFQARQKMGELAVDGILDCLSGKMPQTIVNREIWTTRRK